MIIANQKIHSLILDQKITLWMTLSCRLEIIVFQELSYSSLYSGRILAWDHFWNLRRYRWSLRRLTVAWLPIEDSAGPMPIVARLTKHRETLWNTHKTSSNTCKTSRNTRKTSWTTSKTSWNTRKTLWNTRKSLWNIMKHSNTRRSMRRYRRSMWRYRGSAQRYRRSAQRYRRLRCWYNSSDVHQNY